MIELSPAARQYLLALADDEHMVGAQHATWIGVTPFLEEDLAFCSIAQDELGQYKFNYNTGNQARTEVKTADGVVRGSYSYIDGNGITQKVNYIADALGFRTVGTHLPVAAY